MLGACFFLQLAVLRMVLLCHEDASYLSLSACVGVSAGAGSEVADCGLLL